MGDRPRGLQPGWGRLGLLATRPRPVAAYRWGEDGIAGISDERQRLCLALALWNGADPILKERMFGLTNGEGNHGEDVKEYWFYLDSTPTHSYMQCLYKYPQRAFPYRTWWPPTRRRGKQDFEYELLDTGIFDDDRYFDVIVEYAKADHDDILMRVTAHNRGPEAATLHVLPTLWFRNTWSWGDEVVKPALEAIDDDSVRVSHPDLGDWMLEVDGSGTSSSARTRPTTRGCSEPPTRPRMSKTGSTITSSHDATEAVNPAQTGTKAAVHHRLRLEAGQTATIRVRLTRSGAPADSPLGPAFDGSCRPRQGEADEFYEHGDPGGSRRPTARW